MKIEQSIINQVKKGSRKAQFNLYKCCYGLLLGICLRYKSNKEDADALVNIAFFKILKNIESYKGEVDFGFWARRIMINTVIDEYRKEKKYRERIEPTESEELYGKFTLVDYNKADKEFDAEELRLMLNLLPETTKKIFNLFAIDGYSHKEIGDMMDISDGTSKWHVSVARKKLKVLIGERMRLFEEVIYERR